MSHPHRIPYGKPVRLETRPQASPGGRSTHQPVSISTAAVTDDSDRTRDHLHRFFEALLRRTDH